MANAFSSEGSARIGMRGILRLFSGIASPVSELMAGAMTRRLGGHVVTRGNDLTSAHELAVSHAYNLAWPCLTWPVHARRLTMGLNGQTLEQHSDLDLLMIPAT